MTESQPTETPADSPQLTVTSSVQRPSAPGQGEGSTPEASATAKALTKRSSVLVPAALSAPAIVLPRFWMILTAIVAMVLAVMIAGRRKSKGTGSAFNGSSGVVGRLLQSFLPGVFHWVLLSALLAVGVPAAIGAMVWLVGHGALGTPSAARLAVIHWAPALAAALVCWELWRGALVERRPEGSTLQAALISLPGSVLAAIAAACAVVVLVLGLVAGPSALRLQDLAPGSLGTDVVKLDRTWAQTQTNDVSSCLSTHTFVVWDGTVSVVGNSLHLNLTPDAGSHIDPPRITALMLSLQQQLLGSVTVIKVHLPHRQGIVFIRSRTKLATSPLRDTTALIPGLAVGSQYLDATPAAIRAGLTCGARML